ncbi:alpha/beta hydrolase family protein [Anaerobaca lacustris]|uniref:Acetylxylan esterase n=1 Tax=Anaerobaca lacustris TaxID=3044600 RepID=A0AAW6TQW4_9BACT|nr:acetylxylan esterase [Sedimentisphaerales bacterium M17dextr]
MRTKMRIATIVALCLMMEAVVLAGASLRVLPETLDGGPSHEMMSRYLSRQAQPLFEQWRQQYEQRTAPDQIAAYQKNLREQFLHAIGSLPERTPLNPHVTGVIDRDGYTVEKIIFESQPKHYVTALLFLPDRGRHPSPFPGVLVPCGHASQAKAYEAYQTMGALLALNGMAALVFDPIDQGERSQMPAELPGLWGTTAHTMVGVGSILLGQNTARFMLWDSMRAVDYLQSRPEIDPDRIGCTGNSGGGTQTSHLMALDDRIRVAAPSCYITSFEALLSTIGPQDAEQNVFGQLAFGMDHADYLMMRAPMPILICAATKDFFDIHGTWTSFRSAKRLYTRLDAAERIDLLENDATHNYNRTQREGIARWMSRWLLGKDVAIAEPNIVLLDEDEARCTPDGQVMHLAGARSTYDLNRQFADELAARREGLWAIFGWAVLSEHVRRTAGVRPLAELPQSQIQEPELIEQDGRRIRKVVLTLEDGLYLPALVFHPRGDSVGNALLYLHEGGKEADAGPDGPIDELLKAGRMVVAVDLRGTGETQSRHGWGGGRFGPNTKDVLTAYLLGRSYVGMRTEDILICASLLSDRTNGPVDVIAVGNACVPALHAAALEPDLFGSVRLMGGLRSWADVIASGRSHHQLVNVVHGALGVYDLPDLVRALGDRIVVTEPLDAMGQPL